MEPLLHQLDADVSAVPEHRLSGERLLVTRHRLLRDGWRSVCAAACAGPGGRPSAGVALLARQHLDFGAEVGWAEQVVPAHLVAASLRTAALGRLVVYGIYLHAI